MSGHKISEDGERERCPIHGNNRRMSQKDLSEIKHAVEVANSKAKRAGQTPKGAKVTRFTCTCNCFHVDVE